MAPCFPLQLHLRALAPGEIEARKLSSGSGWFLLEKDFNFCSTGRLGVIWVRRGFCTDFASIPSCMEWVIDGDAPGILYPSVVHDWLYRAGISTRAEADAVLREGMSACGASWAQRWAVWIAVRLAGWRFYQAPK